MSNNMGRVQIFKIELTDRASGAHLTLAAGRELDGDFFLDFGEFVLPLFPEQASAFARAVTRLAWHRQRATPKPGAVWKRIVGDGVGAGFKVEFGLTDEGRCYAEAAGTKIVCDDGQGDLVLAVLQRFAEDVNTVAANVSSASEMPDFGVARGLRGPGLDLPDWADDEKWR
jgi:hypothetical protein